ncbi:tetraacyldisaccharide 4'-kinase [Maribellus sp. CM-23]|uniref:tetraacyldisaccharide 4'-kinase n=1 Tax=Maribellus sp. CM-23 TaxID=2781026 RepID=UPI001F394A7C|nr:tetraacyldisaccharide 4'-kinase [Maribellus sp. CM-23]MCE4567066.1 tetraacyldisaccharide 4'-kinase [Maribellus sp. CM-23]
MLKILLYPLSWLYGLAVYLRNNAYDLHILKSKEFDVPVISIGNITVGGTGKTPHVEYLADLLKEKYRVATLSRGYKRNTKGFRWVETTSTALEVGDEPLQIKHKHPDVRVSVCENRVEGVEQLLSTTDGLVPDVVLLDDAFQHRRITPGINILLIDYNRPVKDDRLLPLGRLRESARQMRRANIIIFTKCPDEVTPIMRRILQNDVGLLPYQSLFFTKLEYGKLTPVFDGPQLGKSFLEERKYALLVVTGIAAPQPLLKYLERFSGQVKSLAFSDHHHYSRDDIHQIESTFASMDAEKKIIITTEKDAMRLKDSAHLSEEVKAAWYYLPVKVSFLEEEKKSFNKKILNYVGENKSHRELYKRKNSGQS